MKTKLIIEPGDILYHKLTGTPLLALEEGEADEEDNSSTVECRYQYTTGEFEEASFYLFELVQTLPKKK